MFRVLFLLVGCAVAVFGFLVMRNPVRLTLLVPGAEGYYQRLVFDRDQRIGLRVVGMLLSLFGLVVLTTALRGLLKLQFLGAVSDGFWGLLSLSFIGVFVFGVIHATVRLVRGRGKELFSGWMFGQETELGPIAVYAPTTPRMRKERRFFTIGYCLLVSSGVAVALLVR
jgi:hypothetical protein